MTIDCLPAGEIISRTPWWLTGEYRFDGRGIRTDTSLCSVGCQSPYWGIPSYWTRRWQRKFQPWQIDTGQVNEVVRQLCRLP